MALVITADSHLDHALSGTQVAHVLKQFKDAGEFFIQTIELPEELGTVECRLYGPRTGDPPVEEDKHPVHYAKRGERQYDSRMVAWKPLQTRQVTVIAGPHDGLPCVLYTVFGGPSTPKEPKDPTLKPEERAESEAFWSTHALASL